MCECIALQLGHGQAWKELVATPKTTRPLEEGFLVDDSADIVRGLAFIHAHRCALRSGKHDPVACAALRAALSAAEAAVANAML